MNDMKRTIPIFAAMLCLASCEERYNRKLIGTWTAVGHPDLFLRFSEDSIHSVDGRILYILSDSCWTKETHDLKHNGYRYISMTRDTSSAICWYLAFEGDSILMLGSGKDDRFMMRYRRTEKED